MATRQGSHTTVTWIPSYVELAEHPKIRRLSEALGESANEVLGILHRLWWYAARYAQDGDLGAFTAVELARACHVPGRKADQFVKKLVEVGWLTEEQRINDWQEYAGRFIGRQAEARDRMRTKRAATTLPNRLEPVVSPAGVPEPRSRTVREQSANSSRTVRTTIREDNIIQPNGTDAPSPAGEAMRVLWSVFDTHLGTATTRTERGRRASAVRDLVAAGADGTLLATALGNWNRVMPGATCSETGVAANLGKLTTGFQATQATRPTTGGKPVTAGSVAVLARWGEITGDQQSSILAGNGTVVGRLPDAEPK